MQDVVAGYVEEIAQVRATLNSRYDGLKTGRAYAPEELPLWVIAVMHGRRSPRVMAAILRSREGRA